MTSVSVSIKKGEWVDQMRDGRVVPYKIYYPNPEPDNMLEQLPVVLWSHGFGGSRDGAAFLSRFLAAQGFAIVHITHIGTDTSLWEGKGGHPWDILRKMQVSRHVTLDRFKDIPFVIDQLETLDIPLDNSKIGMSGHSFGALSTQVACGQMFPDESNVYQSYAEPRLKGGIAYSPVPIDHLGPDNVDNPINDDDIYGSITTPILYMTGTEDTAPIGGAPYTHRFKVFDHTGAQDKFLLVKNGGDHMVYNGTRGKLGAQGNRERLEDMIQTVSLKFWQWTLLDDLSAQEWFKNGEAAGYLNGDGFLKP